MYGFNEVRILDADALVRHPNIAEAGHDILLANPPFAVEDFLQTVPEEERERYNLLATVNDLGNKNVQCFFLERAQQLLKPGAVMGVVVPSSILSNTDSMHIATRKILLKYFDFVAITELGGKTFSQTGTNTVVLFMRRKIQRPEPAEHFANRVQDYFEDWATEFQSGGGEYQDLNAVRQYCVHIGVEIEYYATLLQGKPSAELLASDIFKDYRRDFDKLTDIKKLIDSPRFKKQAPAVQADQLHQLFLSFCKKHEQDKLYYFLLGYNNPMPVLLIKGPSDNKAQQQFLGYEWSGAKGQEGIRYFGGSSVRDIVTPLFDPKDRSNISKISYIVQQCFSGQAVNIPAELQPYVTQAPLIDLLEFGRVEFDAVISLTPKSKISEVNSKWIRKKVIDVCNIEYGKPLPEAERRNGLYPVIGSNGRVGNHTEFLINGPAIVIGRKGSAGLVFWESENCFPIDTTFYIIPKIDINFKYLYEILNYLKLEQYRVGIGVPGLNRSDVYEIYIPLPPLDIQQKIVAECEMVEQAEQAAKIEIEREQDHLTRYLEDACRENQHDKLSNIAKRISDSIDPQKQTGSVNYFGLENIESQTGQKIGNTTSAYSTIKSAKTCFKVGDVLYGKLRPNLNKVHLATEDGICSTDIYVLRFASPVLTKIFVHYLRSRPFNDAVLGTVSGQQLPRTSWTAMGQIAVPVFSAVQQEALLAQVEAVEKTIAAAQATIAAAAEQKQAILQKYL